MFTPEHWRRLCHTSRQRLAFIAAPGTAFSVVSLLCASVLKAWTGAPLAALFCSYVCVEGVIRATSAKPPHLQALVVELAADLAVLAMRRLFRPGKLTPRHLCLAARGGRRSEDAIVAPSYASWRQVLPATTGDLLARLQQEVPARVVYSKERMAHVSFH